MPLAGQGWQRQENIQYVEYLIPLGLKKTADRIGIELKRVFNPPEVHRFWFWLEIADKNLRFRFSDILRRLFKIDLDHIGIQLVMP